ncbi:MAG: hypothetical protein WD823_01050 [Sulfuricaulis sp.]|uniref:hypothetical protein n=1 Tax=Sulfuricaulis sp. TaxID=2003553 RepID=UPI0034A19C8D
MDNWRHLTLGLRLKLSAHPELDVTQASSETKSLVALGFLLDPNNPEAGDQEILDGLLERFDSLEQLLQATSALGGRWAIIATHGRAQYLFTDAFGLRQVFYTLPELAGDLYVMSEPAAAAALLSLPVDDEARAYMDSKEFRINSEYKWPAASSPFRGISRLLPNHYLDLGNGACRRFWPESRLSTVTLEEGTEKIAGILTGLLHAAANRFELAIAVTCGIDSRVVLAACRDIKEKVSFVTLRQWHMADDSPDITIPQTLLMQLGLKHDVINAPVTTTPEFAQIFKSSTYLAHEHYGPDAEAILGRYRRRKVAVTGSGGEVGRCQFRAELPFFDRKRVTAAYLSQLEIGAINGFAMKHFGMWLDDAGPGEGINKLDLFEWEQGCGSWLATTQLEFDMAWKDIFTPFNCRDLVIAMLSVPTKYRKGPNYPLFRCLIQKLWTEVQGAPINPHRKRSAVSQYLHEAGLVARHVLQRFRYR